MKQSNAYGENIPDALASAANEDADLIPVGGLVLQVGQSTRLECRILERIVDLRWAWCRQARACGRRFRSRQAFSCGWCSCFGMEKWWMSAREEVDGEGEGVKEVLRQHEDGATQRTRMWSEREILSSVRRWCRSVTSNTFRFPEVSGSKARTFRFASTWEVDFPGARMFYINVLVPCSQRIQNMCWKTCTS